MSGREHRPGKGPRHCNLFNNRASSLRAQKSNPTPKQEAEWEDGVTTLGPQLPATPRCFYSPRQASSAPSLLPACALLQSAASSDLTITIDDGPDLKVHRTILVGQSPFFESLLSESWKKDTIQLRPGVVELLDEQNCVTWLMHHLYCGLRHLQDWKEAVDVLHLANMCLLPSATSLATEVLKHGITNKTFPLIFNAAALTANCELLEMCKKHIKYNAERILASKELSYISRVAVHHLVQASAIQFSSQTLLFTFIVRWGHYQLARNGQSSIEPTTSSTSSTSSSTYTLTTTTNNNNINNESATQYFPIPLEPPLNHRLRQEVAEFLPQICMHAMTSRFILEVVEENILSSYEVLSLLRYQWKVPGAHLPAIVSCKCTKEEDDQPRPTKKEEDRKRTVRFQLRDAFV